MSFALPTLLPSSPMGTAVKKTVDVVKATTIQTSNDILATQTVNGTFLSLRESTKAVLENATQYKGEWHPDSGSCLNDIVRVLQSKVYYNYLGAPITASVGTWICVAPIPDKRVSDELGTLGINGIYFRRHAGVNYAPQFPEPARLAEASTNETSASGRYWEMLGAGGNYITMSVCVDDVTKVYYVDAYESGSVT